MEGPEWGQGLAAGQGPPPSLGSETLLGGDDLVPRPPHLPRLLPLALSPSGTEAWPAGPGPGSLKLSALLAAPPQ